MAIIELSRDDFLEQIRTNPEAIKKAHTGKEIAEYLIKESFTKKTMGSLNISKTKLLEIALNGDKEEPQPRTVDNGSESLASQIVDGIEEVKKEVHGKGLNKLVKTYGTNSIHALLQKLQPDNIQKAGIAVHILAIIALLVDVTFKDIKEAPKKAFGFIFPKKEQPQEEKAN